MSGKPGARKGDAVNCPRCGRTTIANGSPDVLFDGLPAARQGDCTECDSELNAQVIPNVLINGKPAVVMDSETSHDGVVIGGSGTVLIGSTFTPPPFGNRPITVSGAKSANPLTPQLPGRVLSWEERNPGFASAELEEEEEEVEMEDETVVGITLRIGVFFDGTGNNASNTEMGVLCGAHHPIRAEDLDASCKPYMADTDSSYGNDVTNIKKLSELYYAPEKIDIEGQQQAAFRMLYIDGIGTQTGEKDSLFSAGLGRGERGVAGRVQHAFIRINRVVEDVIERNPGCKIASIIFDTFGFSRGAAAARHFANEVLRGRQGTLSNVLVKNANGLSPTFDDSFKNGIDMGFIGLFDTVPSIAGVTNLGNIQSAAAPGVKLHLPRQYFPHVVHLVARDEHRANFALSRVKPDHLEISLPGVHSDLGGGYLKEAEECVLVSPMQALNVAFGTDVKTTSIYRDALQQKKQLISQGWPESQLVVVTPEPTLLPRDSQDPMGAARLQRVYAGLQLQRPISGELSRVYLRVMHALAKEKGVRFDVIDDADPAYSLPAELVALCDRFVAGDYSTTPQEDELLKRRYIHTSANWNHPMGKVTGGGIAIVYINAPTSDAVRVQHPHVPDSDWRRL
jgi:uncharacterized Zn-binding protein involved in type VI secretion